MRLLTLIAVVSIAMAACGSSPEPATFAPDARAPELAPRRPATLEGLLGAWQPVPYQLDPAFRGRAEEACRQEMDGRPGPALATIDARGGSVVIVRVRGAGVTVCHALQLLPTGQLTGAGSGLSDWPLEQPMAAGVDVDQVAVAAIEGGELKVHGWSVHGRVAPGIRLVVIRPAQGPALVATLENGWFAGWWPATLPQPAADPRLPGPHFVIQGYDAAQELRATLSQ